jgi:hypothetical protein
MMKNTIKISALSIIFLGALLTSCNSTNDKKTMTDEEIATEHTKLAQVAHEKEMAEYQEINRAKIEANEKSLAEFNLRIKNEKMEAKDEYEQKMAELNAQNSDMKKKMDEFHAGNKANWEKFKASFDKDMDDLSLAFTELTRKMGIGNNDAK